jgi:hypothetical protein
MLDREGVKITTRSMARARRRSRPTVNIDRPRAFIDAVLPFLDNLRNAVPAEGSAQ